MKKLSILVITAVLAGIVAIYGPSKVWSGDLDDDPIVLRETITFGRVGIVEDQTARLNAVNAERPADEGVEYAGLCWDSSIAEVP